MTHDDALECVAKLIQLFPQHELSDAELDLYEKQFGRLRKQDAMWAIEQHRIEGGPQGGRLKNPSFTRIRQLVARLNQDAQAKKKRDEQTKRLTVWQVLRIQWSESQLSDVETCVEYYNAIVERMAESGGMPAHHRDIETRRMIGDLEALGCSDDQIEYHVERVFGAPTVIREMFNQWKKLKHDALLMISEHGGPSACRIAMARISSNLDAM